MSSVDMTYPVSRGYFARLESDRTRRPLVDPTALPRLSFAAWWTMFVCSAVALGTSAYLAWSSLTSSPVAGCGGGNLFDCSDVFHTRWSKVLSIPVSIPALATHLTIVGMLLWKPASAQLRRMRMLVIGFASLTAGAAAMWFIGLQLFVIRHLCPYCMAAHTAGLILTIVFMWKLPISVRSLRWVSSGAVASMALLASLQLATEPPKTYEIIHYSDAPETDNATSNRPNSPSDDADLFAPPAAAQFHTSIQNVINQFNSETLLQLSTAINNPTRLLLTEVNASPSAPTRTVEILGGVKLATDAWPIVGKPDAELIFVEMFDYTCAHCRRTHASMKAAEQKYGDRLAVLSLPVPLDGKCNPTVRSTDASHGEACEIAKLAIAVWLVDHNQFADFHNYLFETQADYSQALAKAKRMLDNTKLNSVLRSALPGDYVSKHAALYRKAGAGQIPKLLFQRTATVGAVESSSAMIQLIEQHVAR